MTDTNQPKYDAADPIGCVVNLRTSTLIVLLASPENLVAFTIGGKERVEKWVDERIGAGEDPAAAINAIIIPAARAVSAEIDKRIPLPHSHQSYTRVHRDSVVERVDGERSVTIVAADVVLPDGTVSTLEVEAASMDPASKEVRDARQTAVRAVIDHERGDKVPPDDVDEIVEKTVAAIDCPDLCGRG